MYSKGNKWLLPIQFFFSSLIIVFCMHQIQKDIANIATYWGGITSIIAYWLPSPTDNK